MSSGACCVFLGGERYPPQGCSTHGERVRGCALSYVKKVLFPYVFGPRHPGAGEITYPTAPDNPDRDVTMEGDFRPPSSMMEYQKHHVMSSASAFVHSIDTRFPQFPCASHPHSNNPVRGRGAPKARGISIALLAMCQADRYTSTHA